MKNRKYKILLLAFIVSLGLISCQPSNKTPLLSDSSVFTFVFYNVENLYDTYDDPGKGDQEFLPGSPKQWNAERYLKKISDLSEVLKEIGEKELPEIIGLCEVENVKVVRDLVAHKNLSGGKYKIVHFEDHDPRGIDMALVYRPDEFAVQSQQLLPVRNRQGKTMSRGILYVTGRSGNGEIFHIFINHWPSRERNESSSESGRNEMAMVLKNLTGPLTAKNANVVIMGDMNDEPDNISLRFDLGAQSPGNNGGLINLMYPAMRKGLGTYNFRGDWQMLDNVIASSSLLDGKGYRVKDNKAEVFSRNWMVYTYRNGDFKPDRTYTGDKYTGGPSDHFPVFFRLIP
jgi:endonuclease/exonuclease/phosphatase family metal-dependent hydrolase